MKKKQQNQGFTLLELLIVIAIIAILSVVLILVLDPAETLKKSRDTQRMSDLSTVKTALGLYSTSTSSPIMAGTTNLGCKGDTSVTTWKVGEDRIYYSYPSDGAVISDLTLDGQNFTSSFGPKQVTNANSGLTDGTGWLPVNLNSLSGGSPISNFPVDPVNSVTVGGVSNTDFTYRYACLEKKLKYEIDAILESTSYSVDDNKMAKDGGNNPSYYEVGTDLTILGSGTDF